MMKKLKLLSLLLAVLMLFSSAALFSSCGKQKDGNVKLSKKTVEVTLKDYAIVYGDSQSGSNYTAAFKQRMADLATAVSAAAGKSMTAQTQDRAKTGAGDPEILIGLTTRQESVNAHASIKGDGFTIQVVGNKIVIVGTTNLLTLQAAQYFVEKFVTADNVKDGVLTMNESALSQKLESVVIADSADTNYYSMVYRTGVYTGSGSPDFPTTLTGDYRDYEAVAVDSIAERMKSLTKLSQKQFKGGTDEETTDKEILIGRVNREVSENLLKTLDADEWGIFVEGDKIVLNSWNNNGLICAGSLYVDLLTEAATKDADGNVKIVFPQGLRLTGVADAKWILDFPKPEGDGIELYNTMDASDGALQFLYTGSGVNAAAFEEYYNKLKSEGYTVLTENSAAGNEFATLVNKDEGIAVYVAYNAYAYKDNYEDYYDYASKVKTGDTDYYDWDASLRVVSAPIDHEFVSLPDAKILSPQSYLKRTDSMISTMPIYNSAVGLMFIVTLEDGSFVVFDSGALNPEGTEHVQLWTTLSALHTQIWGETPSVSNPVRIAAWVVTHAHGDHFNAFYEMLKYLKSSGQTKKLKIDYMLGNFPNFNAAYPLRNGVSDFTDGAIQNFQNYANGGFTYVKVHTGQKLYLANLEIEVLATWEDLNPRVTHTDNDTNTVLRFSMSNKDAPNAEPVTQIWTGDANRWQSRWMCATWGDYLKADMVSVAHHGNLGCEAEFYDLVSPTAVWWPHNASAAWNYLKGDAKTQRWCFEVDQHLIYEIPSVQYMYTAGGNNSERPLDGCFTTLILRAGGPDYDNLVDALTGEPIAYNGYNVAKAPFNR